MQKLYVMIYGVHCEILGAPCMVYGLVISFGCLRLYFVILQAISQGGLGLHVFFALSQTDDALNVLDVVDEFINASCTFVFTQET